MQNKLFKFGLLPLILIFTLAICLPAWAQYGGTGDLGTGSTTTAPPGGTMTVSGSGFEPGIEVKVYIHSDYGIYLGSTNADSNGYFSLTVTIPSDLPTGEHTLTAVGGDRVLTSTITVAGSAVSTAYTGAPIIFIVLVGTVLYGLGAAMILKNKKKKDVA